MGYPAEWRDYHEFQVHPQYLRLWQLVRETGSCELVEPSDDWTHFPDSIDLFIFKLLGIYVVNKHDKMDIKAVYDGLCRLDLRWVESAHRYALLKALIIQRST